MKAELLEDYETLKKGQRYQVLRNNCKELVIVDGDKEIVVHYNIVKLHGHKMSYYKEAKHENS